MPRISLQVINKRLIVWVKQNDFLISLIETWAGENGCHPGGTEPFKLRRLSSISQGHKNIVTLWGESIEPDWGATVLRPRFLVYSVMCG
jgi:hypothetical protein